MESERWTASESPRSENPGTSGRLGRELNGRELRWFLTVKLVDAGRPMTIRDLIAALHDAGFTVAGRASKVISDTLRWQNGRQRVVRIARGVYQASARIPRTTLRRLRQRVTEAGEQPLRPVRTQPLRSPRPLVSPGGPKRLRRRRFNTNLRPMRHRQQDAPAGASWTATRPQGSQFSASPVT